MLLAPGNDGEVVAPGDAEEREYGLLRILGNRLLPNCRRLGVERVPLANVFEIAERKTGDFREIVHQISAELLEKTAPPIRFCLPGNDIRAQFPVKLEQGSVDAHRRLELHLLKTRL